MMSTTAQRSATTPIPVQLSEPGFEAFLLPHLSMPKRGPKCKLGYYRVFNLILWVLYTGMQWKCLAIPQDPQGKPAIHDTRIGRTKALFAPLPWPPAAGSGSSRAAMAASSALSQSPTAVAHRKASRGCAAAWTYGSGARRGVAQGFPGARVSRRPVGDSLGGTIAHGMSRRTEVQDPAAARTALTRPRVTPWVEGTQSNVAW